MKTNVTEVSRAVRGLHGGPEAPPEGAGTPLRSENGRRLRRCTSAVLAVLVTATLSRAGGPPDPPRPDPQPQEESLAERLIRQTTGESSDDLMGTIIHLMNETSRKLELEFDAGDETQALQRRISAQLDEAVRIAAAQRRPVRSSQPAGPGDRRRMPDQPGARAGQGEPAAASRQGASEAVGEVGGQTAATGKRRAGALVETRRAWGHLPMRERDEIIQGADEQFLERYRVWIENYYRALQEPPP